jgi:hypothetical protein
VPKGVIVLLVVVAVVFVVVLAMGGGQGDSATPQDPPGIVDALGGLGGGQQLRIDEDGVTADCDPGATAEDVVVSPSCEITVPARGRFSRPLEAGLDPQSGSIHAVFTPNEGDEQEGDAPGDAQCLSLAVDRHGGRIEITCSGGGQCPVSLRAEGCEQ